MCKQTYAERNLKVTREHSISKTSYCYKSFHELIQRIKCLTSLKAWQKFYNNDTTVLEKQENPYLLPKLDDSLGFTIQIFEWFLSETHMYYKNYKRSLRNITVSELIGKIESSTLCNGTDTKEISWKYQNS